MTSDETNDMHVQKNNFRAGKAAATPGVIAKRMLVIWSRELIAVLPRTMHLGMPDHRNELHGFLRRRDLVSVPCPSACRDRQMAIAPNEDAAAADQKRRPAVVATSGATKEGGEELVSRGLLVWYGTRHREAVDPDAAHTSGSDAEPIFHYLQRRLYGGRMQDPPRQLLGRHGMPSERANTKGDAHTHTHNRKRISGADEQKTSGRPMPRSAPQAGSCSGIARSSNPVPQYVRISICAFHPRVGKQYLTQTSVTQAPMMESLALSLAVRCIAGWKSASQRFMFGPETPTFRYRELNQLRPPLRQNQEPDPP
jgi:hypothetical protein